MRSDEQIAEKKLSTIRAFNALRKVGIASREMSASMKTFLFKVCCRPILYYGAENLILNKRDIKAMQSAEASLIKYSLNLSKRVKSTKLLLAMEMEPTFSRIESIKLNFFLRLTKNDLTNEIIRKIAQEHTSSGNESLTKRSLIGEIMNYTNDDILNEGE
jgi:hypothetical protein